MPKRYVIELTDDERASLEDLPRKGKAAARKVLSARALLLCDEGWTDEQVAEELGLGTATLERLRKRVVTEGLAAALERRPRRWPRLLDGAAEARLVTLACGPPPPGRKRWTLRLLADRLVELGAVDRVAHETVRQALKETSCGRGACAGGASRPSRARRSCARWKTCSRSTTGPKTRSGPTSASTRRASSCWRTRARPCRRARGAPPGTMTNTGAAASRTCSSPSSR